MVKLANRIADKMRQLREEIMGSEQRTQFI